MNIKQSGKVSLSKYICAAVLCLVISLLIFTTSAVIERWKAIQGDRKADSDFRRLKTAVFAAVADREKPKRIMLWRQQGPTLLGYPLEGARLQKGIHADIFHHTRRSRTSRPTTITHIQVKHANSPWTYSFTEVNGIVYERIVAGEG